MSWKNKLFQVTIFHVFKCLSVPFTENMHTMHTQRDYGEGSSNINEQISGLHSPTIHNSFGATSISQPSYLNSQAFTHVDSSIHASEVLERNDLYFRDDFETITIKSCNSFSSTKSEQVNFFYMSIFFCRIFLCLSVI